MRRRFSLLVALVGGALLLVAAPLARTTTGGTFVINLAAGVDSLDPAIAYSTVAWQLEYATCAKLVNYPDAEAPRGSQLVPEVATSMPRVSVGGREYTFTIRAGDDAFRFSDGTPVTAWSFARAIVRARSPRLDSPAERFVRDVTRVRVRANTLSVSLAHAIPDFLSRMALPFFCAVPERLPIGSEGVLELPGAGPYYVAEHVPNRRALLRRNRYYRGTRPHGPDRIEVLMGVRGDDSLRAIERGTADYAADGLPASSYASLAARYGVNRDRFFVKPRLGVWFLKLNTTRELFKDNPLLRRAVNYAVDRPAALRAFGALSGRRTDQLLPPGTRGFRDADLYPLAGSDYATARRLAEGRTRSGRATLYVSNRPYARKVAEIVTFNLAQIGIDVELWSCGRACWPDNRCAADLELAGWVGDYPDPASFLDPRADYGPFECFDRGRLDQRFAAADRLEAERRDAALGRFDVATMRDEAPVVPLHTINDRIFVSARTKNVVYNPVYGLDLAALRLG